MKNKITPAMIQELCTICTYDEAGRHFAETSRYWVALEEAGLIAVCRPVHETTGIPYGQDAWSIEVTEAGQAVVDTHAAGLATIVAAVNAADAE